METKRVCANCRDEECARLIASGADPMAETCESFKFKSPWKELAVRDGYKISRHAMGYIGCNCSGWVYQKRRHAYRIPCKHIRMYLDSGEAQLRGLLVSQGRG